MSNAVYLTHGTGAVAYRQVDSMKRANRGAGIPLRAHHTAKQPIKTKAEYLSLIHISPISKEKELLFSSSFILISLLFLTVFLQIIPVNFIF